MKIEQTGALNIRIIEDKELLGGGLKGKGRQKREVKIE